MDSGIMILIGIAFILVAVIFLASQGKKERAMYEDILEKYNDIKEYSDTIEQIVDNLDKLIDSFLTTYNSGPKRNVKSGQIVDYMVGESQIKKPQVASTPKADNHKKEAQGIDEKTQNEDPETGVSNEIQTNEPKASVPKTLEEEKEDIYYTLKKLKEEGLSNQEIAKKLGKGIREIDIMTKMIKFKDGNSLD